MTFKRNVQEEKIVIQGSETLTTEIDGWDVIVSTNANGLVDVSIARITSRDRAWLPILKFWPHHVDDLDDLAASLPALLPQVAQALRDAGKSDLRSESHRHMDEFEQRVSRLTP